MAKKANTEVERLDEAQTAPEADAALEESTPPEAPEAEDPKPDGENKISVTLRHKTEYPLYRRAGLVLKQTPGEFSVTTEQLEILKKDKWVEAGEA